MPLFWAYSVKTDSATVEEIAAARDDHLRWQFENEKLGNLLGAGPVFDPDVDGPPVAGIYILVCNDAARPAPAPTPTPSMPGASASTPSCAGASTKALTWAWACGRR